MVRVSKLLLAVGLGLGIASFMPLEGWRSIDYFGLRCLALGLIPLASMMHQISVIFAK